MTASWAAGVRANDEMGGLVDGNHVGGKKRGRRGERPRWMGIKKRGYREFY